MGQRIAEVKVLKKWGGMIGGSERRMHKKLKTIVIRTLKVSS